MSFTARRSCWLTKRNGSTRLPPSYRFRDDTVSWDREQRDQWQNPWCEMLNPRVRHARPVGSVSYWDLHSAKQDERSWCQDEWLNQAAHCQIDMSRARRNDIQTQRWLAIWDMRYDMRYEIWDMIWDMTYDMRYEIWYEIWDMRYVWRDEPGHHDFDQRHESIGGSKAMVVL